MVKEKKLDLKEYNHIRIDWIKQSKRDNCVIKLKKKLNYDSQAIHGLLKFFRQISNTLVRVMF